MKFQRLFELRIQHDVYPDGRCNDLRIEPRAGHPTGTRALARHRLVARQRPQGLEVVARIDDGADLFRSAHSATDDLLFGFDLHATGSEFAVVTELGTWAGPDRPIYRNPGPTSSALQLVQRAAAAAEQPTVVAVLEIAGLTPEALVEPPSFTLNFAARQVYWVYYLLTTRTRAELPQIRDAAPKRPIEFSRKQLSLGNTAASVDPTGRRLLERHAEHRCFRLRSKRPVAFQRGARRKLALYLGDELLIRELPLPSAHGFNLLTLKPGEPHQAVHQVVEY